MNESSNELQELRAENFRLRTLLAITYSGYKLYVEDGNLQDSSAAPVIDFKNDSVGDIDKKMMRRAVQLRKREDENNTNVRRFFGKLIPNIMKPNVHRG